MQTGLAHAERHLSGIFQTDINDVKVRDSVITMLDERLFDETDGKPSVPADKLGFTFVSARKTESKLKVTQLGLTSFGRIFFSSVTVMTPLYIVQCTVS